MSGIRCGPRETRMASNRRTGIFGKIRDVDESARRGLQPPPDLTATPALEGALALAELTNATSLYRYYDRHDFLIYVGITSRGKYRNHEHNKNADWWPYVARQEVEHFDTREQALNRERELIHLFRPPFNTQHNPDWHTIRGLYLAWSVSDPTSEDPLGIYVAIRHKLPLAPMGMSGKTLLLRTLPEHAPIASRLVLPDDRPVLATKGKLRTLQVNGPYALLTVRTSVIPPILSARAEIGLKQNKPPFVFRLRAVKLTPDPGVST